MMDMELMLRLFYLCLKVEKKLEVGDKLFFSMFVFVGVVFEIINY